MCHPVLVKALTPAPSPISGEGVLYSCGCGGRDCARHTHAKFEELRDGEDFNFVDASYGKRLDQMREKARARTPKKKPAVIKRKEMSIG